MALLAVVLIGGYLLARFTHRETPLPPGGVAPANALPQAAYVKERQWNDAVRAAVKNSVVSDVPLLAASDSDHQNASATGNIRQAPPPLSGLCILCAEIGPAAASLSADAAASRGFQLTRPAALDWPLLATLPQPVSLLLRIRGGLAENNDAATITQREPFPTLRRALDETLAQTEIAGLHPAEIQLQFDVPATPSGIAAASAWLTALRTAYPGQTLSPVLRPSLVRSPDFPTFAKTAGGYILDLQGIERFGGSGADTDSPGGGRRLPETLCDPTAALEAVGDAGKVGVPFRVSLPATGFRLILDSAGRLLSMTTEPLHLAASSGRTERLLRPNAEEMAELVAALNTRRPTTLIGILWDRLSVDENNNVTANDRLDWPPATFRAVRAGRVPRAKLEWEFPAPPEGSDRRELALRNHGEAEGPLPPLLTVRCPAPPLAVEAAAPYELVAPAPREHLTPREVRFRLTKPSSDPAASTAPRSLLPGAVLVFGAVRLPPDTDPNAPTTDEVGADLEPDLAAPTPSP